MANNNDCIKNWHEEKGDGKFIAKSNKPQNLYWWAEKVKEGRQLTSSASTIRNLLIAFNNNSIIKGKTDGLFDRMFIGVYQNTNFSLYRDVTATVNQIVKKAIKETEEMAKDPLFRISQSMLDFLTSLGIYLISMNFGPDQASKMTRLFINGTPLGKIFSAVLTIGSIFLTGFQAQNHVLNFMYKTKWADNVKHKGRWDFKRNTEPFNNVKEGTRSRFFHYKGHNKSYKLHDIPD